MSEPTRVQILFAKRKPAFAVLPWDEYRRLVRGSARVPAGDRLPQEVVELHALDGLSLRRAWREHLGLTQSEVAARLGITQSALSQLESTRARPRRATLARLARALGISVRQLG